MALHGHTILDLLDEKKHIVRRFEKDNAISTYQQKLMGKGNFHYLTQRDKFMPVAEKFFSGCILTDGRNATNGLPINMIEHSSNIIAQASNDAYTGAGNLRRGSMDQYLSHPIANGYQFVWNWDQSHGNGTIKSVCLCRPELGKIEMKATADAISADEAYANEFMANNVAIDLSLSELSIIDYENAVGYKVWYEDDAIKIEKWSLNTKVYHLNGSALAAISKLEESSIVPTGGVVGYNAYRSCVSFTGDTIHFITFVVTESGGVYTTTVHDYQISTSDISALSDVDDYVFQGVSFDEFASGSLKDAIPIDATNHKLYACCNSGTKIAICDLQNTTNIVLKDNPLASYSSSYKNGACLWLPNGDFYKFNVESWISGEYPRKVIYFHAGEFYATKMLYKELYGGGLISVHGNNYGSALVIGRGGTTPEYQKMHLETFAPYVTTVNDLTDQQVVTKTPRYSMRLTYTLTES